MTVRVMALVVKSRVPAQVIWNDFHLLGKYIALLSEEGYPCGGVIISQPSCILSLHGNDGRPDVPGMLRHFFGYLRQNQRHILIGKQAMTAQLFGSWTGGNVVDIDLLMCQLIQIMVNGCGNKCRCIFESRLILIVLIFK
jgi:hypothetical protein